MKSNLYLYLSLGLGAAGLTQPILAAGIDDLWITEIMPSSGMVEVTNIGNDSVTTSSSLPFCYRFTYSSGIPANTSFSPGESKLYQLSGLNSSDSDVWLYRDGNFSSAGSILNGLKYGPQANIGRASVAQTAGIWPSPSAFVPSPPASESLQLTGDNPYSPESWTSAPPNLGTFTQPTSEPVVIKITLKNLAPEMGNFLTPPWVAFHDGTFDLFSSGEAASPELERLAEDGATGPLTTLHSTSFPGVPNATLADNGPLAPGQETSWIFEVHPDNPQHRYLSFLAMIIPSNDAFIGNGDPMRFPLFNAQGQVLTGTTTLLAESVYDAGTEVNDEVPANTAFLGQMDPNTGDPENGVVHVHTGFQSPGAGGIVDDPRFTQANFADGSNRSILSLTIETLQPNIVPVVVEVENLAPAQGNYLTPPWVAFHNGHFDSYDSGSPTSPELERLAEDGMTGPIAQAFLDSMAGTVEGTLADNGPLAPGNKTRKIFHIDLNAPSSRYFSFISMVIPSNDAYIANGNPTLHRIVNGAGHFIGADFQVNGSAINDAGTEINDEIPENTAFLAQAAPNTGETENGVNTQHPGFKAKGMGGILDDPRFSNADFTQPDYAVARITVRAPNLIPVVVEVENLAPQNGTYLTPLWVAFHNGTFDSYNSGSPASPELERLAEDGMTGPIAEAFLNSGAGMIEGTLNEIGPIAPGAKTSKIFWLNADSPNNRYFSYAAMVIPSNDAFIANGQPMEHPLFNPDGSFAGADFVLLGSDVNDAGTEVNDEVPANTAFLAQAAPNTGETENGVVTLHPGFKPAGQGSILNDPRFSQADFAADVYTLARIRVRSPELRLMRDGTGLQVHFDGTLQFSTQVQGPYETVEGAASPLQVSNPQNRGYWRTQLNP